MPPDNHVPEGANPNPNDSYNGKGLFSIMIIIFSAILLYQNPLHF